MESVAEIGGGGGPNAEFGFPAAAGKLHAEFRLEKQPAGGLATASKLLGGVSCF